MLLLDAIVTGDHPPGTVLELSREDFTVKMPGDFKSPFSCLGAADVAQPCRLKEVPPPSLHYVGLPEILKMAERLGIPFPKEMRILALEVEEPREFREGLTPAVEGALPIFVERARQVLEDWMFKGAPSVSSATYGSAPAPDDGRFDRATAPAISATVARRAMNNSG